MPRDTRLTVDRIIDLLSDGRPRSARDIDWDLRSPRDLHEQLRLLVGEGRVVAVPNPRRYTLPTREARAA